METDIDELLNGPAEETEEPDFSQPPTPATAIPGLVTITWLMQAFKMDRQTVRRKLQPCPPIRMGKGNSPIYDFRQACQYLVKPRVDINEYMKTMKINDMPPLLQKEFWDAKLKRQNYEVRAGDLWHTSDVIAVFGDCFKQIKTSVNLWADNLDRVQGLSPEMREKIVGMTDTLQDDLYERLVEMGEKNETTAQIGKLEEELRGMESPDV